MSKPTTIGIDLAKTVFQVVSLNAHNKVVSNRPLRRTQLIEKISQRSLSMLARHMV